MTDQLIAILGAGQLGRMLALAGYPLGLRFRLLDPTPNSPAGQLAEHIVAPYSDPAALERLTDNAACVTYEFENIAVEVVRAIEEHTPVFPPSAALQAAQDRLVEKRFFQQIGAATPLFAPVDSRADLEHALAEIGLPAVLKTRHMGYDGKGQAVIHSVAEADAVWAELGGQPLILEGFVQFRRELSIIAVRSRSGETAFYPLIENHHSAGILRRSVAPAPEITTELQSEAESIATRALDTLSYVGVLAIELFEVDDRQPTTDDGLARSCVSVVGRRSSVVVNEMAPRVHNSGHWTIEGAATSQFENHLRAILGLPLGETAACGYSVMLNIIGDLPDTAALLAIPGAHVHLYGKTPRPGRKLGHLTLCAANTSTLATRVAQATLLLSKQL